MIRKATLSLVVLSIALLGAAPLFAPGASEIGRLSTPSQVTLQVAAKPLSEVVSSLSAQTGNAPFALADDLRDTPVTLRLKDVTYWEAVDALCQSTGLLCVPDLDTGGLRLDKPVKREEIGATSGAVACKLDRVTRLGEYRIFRQDGEPGELSCVFRYFWEDRLPVIRAEAEVVEAFAPDGRRLYKSQQPEPAPWRISFRQGRRPPTGALVVTLTRLPEGIRKVQEIEGLVRLWIGTGKKEIAIRDVLFHPGDKASAPGLTLVLQSATRTGNRIDVAVEAEIAGSNACFIAESCTPRYGFFLEGPDRKRRPAAVERIERDLRAKAGEEKETAEKAADVTGKVTVWMKFEDLPDAAGWTLVYCGPESIKADDVRFKIKDIPVR